jgi:hypothetical protein
MAGNAFSRDTIRLILMGIMGICLAVALTVGTAALMWSGQPYGDTLRMTAGIFAWIFTAAFSISFIIAVIDERRMVHARQAGGSNV